MQKLGKQGGISILQNLLKGKSNNTLIQLFRYLFVGGSAFIVDFGLLYILTKYCGVYYLLSATLSFIAGLIINYLLSISWVFNNSRLKNKWLEFIVFAIIGCVGLILNIGLLWFFTEICLLYYLFSKILATALVLFWNFFARKYALFNPCSKSNNYE